MTTTSRARRPQPRRRRRAEDIESVELAVHPDAQRLERSRRRIDALIPALWNGASHDGREPRRRRRSPAPRARARSRGRCGARSALRRNAKITSAQLPLSSASRTQSAAVGPVVRSIRMSSGASARKLNPRASLSSCIDDTPRSASTPSTAVNPRRSSMEPEVAIVAVHELHPIPPPRQPLPRHGQRLAVAIDPDDAGGASLEQAPACGRRAPACSPRSSPLARAPEARAPRRP